MPKVKPIKKSRSKTQKPPAIDKLLKPSVGVVLGLLGYFFLKGMKSEIPRIDVSNEIQLREVLFGEMRRDTVISATDGNQPNEQQKAKNYVVLCHSDDTGDKANKHLSSVFIEAKQNAYKELADFVLMDCDYILPSGKSIAKRFDLDLKIRPTIFVSGRFGSPKQILSKYLKTGPMLLKLLKQMIEPHPTKISNTKNLKATCLDKEYCAVLIKGDTPTPKLKASMQQLMETYEDNKSLEFASLDGTALAITNLEEYQELVPKGKFQFLLFKKVSGGLKAATSSEPKKKSNDDLDEEGGDNEEETKPKPKQKTKSDSRLISSASIYESEDYSFSALQSFLSTQMSSLAFKKLPVLPAISTRTKKVEKISAEKRNRILEQRRRAYEKQINPELEKENLSADRHAERRADREEKRAEHNKQHNVKQRTPEEIAEIERARRKRMEEEAAKWNIQEEVDDGSNEDIASDEDGDTSYFEEDVLDEDMDLDEEEEDEDIIDMDLD